MSYRIVSYVQTRRSAASVCHRAQTRRRWLAPT